jgi:2-(1,2-epoxy-1,2-dihydrophenyl)acetyl-CoA isomerase
VYRTLILAREDGVNTITLNRPEVLNALDTTLTEELGLAIDEVSADNLARVLVITGAGRGFCAGGDLKSLPLNPNDIGALKHNIEKWHGVLLKIKKLKKPVIASVNGVAVGAGCDLALICDIRIASENAKFGEVYVKIGGVPDSGGTYLLPRLIGIAKAFELLCTGDMIEAKDAERIGLVNKVVSPDQLNSITKALAVKLAKGAPIAMGMIKEAIYLNLSQDVESALSHAAYMASLCMQTEDAKEGIVAFQEKREPNFKGK